MASEFPGNFIQARLEQEAENAAELRRLISLKESETQLMKDQYNKQQEVAQILDVMKTNLARGNQESKYLLEIIAAKTSSFELRHCEQSYEMPGAARNLQVFVQATGRGSLSRQHLQAFADWIESGECSEDFNYGQINMAKDTNRAQYQATVVWFKHNEDSLMN